MDCKESNGVCLQETGSVIVAPSAADEQPVSLEPKTPVAKRENKDLSLSCDSPVIALKTVPKAGCFDDEACGLTQPFVSVDPTSPQTPKDGVFDPFAPGPDSLAWAPVCKKYTDRLKVSVARPLRFDLSIENDNLDSVLDREIFDSMYESLLEFIVSKKLEEISGMGVSSDKLETPLTTRLRASPDDCPGAPLKPPAEARDIDLGLCRKLF